MQWRNVPMNGNISQHTTIDACGVILPLSSCDSQNCSQRGDSISQHTMSKSWRQRPASQLHSHAARRDDGAPTAIVVVHVSKCFPTNTIASSSKCNCSRKDTIHCCCSNCPFPSVPPLFLPKILTFHTLQSQSSIIKNRYNFGDNH